ncbi:hypothetical protein D3C76_1726150 [compost metagenome]
MLRFGSGQPGVMIIAGLQGQVAQGCNTSFQLIALGEETPVFGDIDALCQARAVGGVVFVGEGLKMRLGRRQGGPPARRV